MKKINLKTGLIIALAFRVITATAQCASPQATLAYTEALTAYRGSEPDKALNALNRCIYLYASCAEAYLLRASVWEQLNKPENALTDIRTAKWLNPSSREMAFRQALILFGLNRWQQAMDSFIEVLALPDGETLTVFYAVLPHRHSTVGILTTQSDIRPTVFNYLGLAATALERCTEAVQWFDSAMALQGRKADVLVNRAAALLVCGDSSEAVDNLREALTLEPRHALAFHYQALLSATGEDAGQQFTQAIMADSLLADA